MKDPVRDVVITFGVISTLFTIRQMVLAGQSQQKAQSQALEHKRILTSLARIEKKLGL